MGFNSGFKGLKGYYLQWMKAKGTNDLAGHLRHACHWFAYGEIEYRWKRLGNYIITLRNDRMQQDDIIAFMSPNEN